MPSDKILIVDDEAAIREMISIALDLAGYNCIEAEDALQAHHLVVDEGGFKSSGDPGRALVMRRNSGRAGRGASRA